ncbi:phage tail collar domain [Candidatus Termititenax aidoneus]|uniref:Phage tail collar domain n=1 Tax=Termititenax aidoneus TaxID=2218524 RepID=A0A388TD66_TERA1|nr:phage tail collar domain [Candidatus Termititenax aidoneus]
MANNYTDTTDTDFTGVTYNIETGKNLSAEGMRNALHTKENVVNKQVSSTDETADTLNANSSDDYYPSSKLAGKNFAVLRSGKQDKIAAGTANDIVAYSGTAGSFGTLTRATTLETDTTKTSNDKIPTEAAVVVALSGKENTSNKATSIIDTNKDDAVKYPTIGAVTAWANIWADAKENSGNKVTSITAANIEDTAKYPTVGAITTWATTALMDILLPAGTILAMNTSSWVNASETFKGKWKVCDGTGGAPDLRYKFLRGGTASDPVSGDGKKTLSIDEIPEHSHRHTHLPHSNHQGETDGMDDNSHTASGVFSVGGYTYDTSGSSRGTWLKMDAEHDNNHSYDETTAGGGQAFDVIPAFYTVIYIMKVN